MRHLTAVLVGVTVLAGCAVVREARMAQPAALAGVAEESFGKPGWGRRGELMLSGQRVRYERGADRLSLLGKLETGRAPLRYTWSAPGGDSRADCSARQLDAAVAGVVVSARPWALSCRWSGQPEAQLQMDERPGRFSRMERTGSYRRGALALAVRGVHLLDGSPLPQVEAVGYELLHDGQVVGSVDLSGAVPRLRRPDPATPLGRAVTEAALVLALVWEPA